MLFALHDSLLGELQKPEVDHQLIELLEDLARYRQAGFHLITGSRRLLKAITNLSNLSRRSSDLYWFVLEELTQLGNVTTLLARRIEITDGYATNVLTNSDGSRAFQIPYRKLQTLSVFNKTILLSENLVDAKIYAHIADAYIAMNRLSGIKLNFEKRGGGGSTIAGEYHEIQQNQERLCLCVVDSDRKTPNWEIGSTAKNVTAKDDSDILLCEVAIIEPRDIENFLPTSVLREIVQEASKLSMIEMLETIDACPANSDARYHLDIKKGITLGEVLHSPAQEEFHKYWKTVLTRYDFSKNLACNVSANCNNPKECTCIIAAGLGDKIAEEFYNKFLNVSSSHKVVERVSTVEHLRSNWESIGRIIAAWGCGSQARRTIYAA